MMNTTATATRLRAARAVTIHHATRTETAAARVRLMKEAEDIARAAWDAAGEYGRPGPSDMAYLMPAILADMVTIGRDATRRKWTE